MKNVPINTDSSLKILMKMMKNPIDYDRRMVERYGDVFQFNVFKNKYFSISNPDCLRHILKDKLWSYPRPVKGGGSHEVFIEYCGNQNNLRHTWDPAYWKKSGEAVTPAFFSKDRYKAYTTNIAQSALEAAEGWNLDEKVNVKLEALKLGARAVMYNLFDHIPMDFDRLFEEKSKVFAQIGKRGFAFPLMRLLLSSQDRKDWKEGKEYVQSFTAKAIADRLVLREDYNDILGGLIQAFRDDPDRQQVIANLNSEFRMYLVTGESLAAGLNSALAILSQHPLVEQKILEEMAEVLKGESPTFESMEQLKYLHCFVKEVLRFLPPAMQVARVAAEDDEMMGYHVPKGSVLLLKLYWTHRNKAYWDNPEGFDPDRFRDKPWGQDHEYAYIPFSGGPRDCIGGRFSLHVFAVTLATLLQRYRFKLLPGTTLMPEGLVLGFPKGADFMEVERRVG